MEHNIYRNFLFLKKEKFEEISNKININTSSINSLYFKKCFN